MNRTRFDIPSISTLVAFEATARLGGVSLAANELTTSQSAISRYIRALESALDVTLFERKSRKMTLTTDGEDYRVAVHSALESLHAACHELRTQGVVLNICCTQEVSVLLLGPVFSQLKRSLPECVKLRILSCDYDILPMVVPTGVDIIFEYSAARTDAASARILDEEIVPVASPSFMSRFDRVLSGHPRHWTGVPRLELAPRDQSWATWTTWFAAHECQPPLAPVETFENYMQLLEAAVNGDGIAIGWNGFVDSYLKNGTLVPLTDAWLASSLGLYAVLTLHGRQNSYSQYCLKRLDTLMRKRAHGRELPVREIHC